MIIEYKKTERKYWRNGYQSRGQGFKCYTMSFYFVGVLVAWQGRKILSISFYRFI